MTAARGAPCANRRDAPPSHGHHDTSAAPARAASCRRVGLLALVVLVGCAPPRSRGVECVAPANPGGGWDLTCRAAGQVMSELSLVRGFVRVTNMPGAGGAIAFAHAVAKRAGDQNVIFAASPATTLRLAQHQFGRFTEDDVRWIGAIAADYGVIAVNPASPWQSLTQLVEAWKADPSKIVVGGGSAVGGQDHMKMLVLARAAGIDPRAVRYVPFDGGGEATTALLGNFIQVFSGDASEIRGLAEAGSVRVLAVLSLYRLGPPFEAVPTAIEQGVDVQWIAWRGFYAPPGITEDAFEQWSLIVTTVASSPEWAKLRLERGLDVFYLSGPQFENYVKSEILRLRELSRELGLIE
jgi:putative tricarboxylic transport membrane protein